MSAFDPNSAGPVSGYAAEMPGLLIDGQAEDGPFLASPTTCCVGEQVDRNELISATAYAAYLRVAANRREEAARRNVLFYELTPEESGSAERVEIGI